MGIDINWRMIQGATLDEWKKVIPESFYEDEPLDEYLTEFLCMDYISPYFDSEVSDQIFGKIIEGDEWVVTVNLPELQKKVNEEKLKFFSQYNIETYIGQHVW